jgi:hypothetical protein
MHNLWAMSTIPTVRGYLETGPVQRSRSATPDLDALAHLMDGAFRIPGLNIRFGLDSIIGLVPGLGDLVTTLVSLYVVAAAQRYGVSRITTLRMGLNIGIDTVIGSIPLIGDLFDFAWKANERNVALVRTHMNTPLHMRRKARRGDWLYVGVIGVVLIAILAAVLFAAYTAFSTIFTWIAG